MVGSSVRSFVTSSLFILVAKRFDRFSGHMQYISFCSVSGGCDIQYWLGFVRYSMSWVCLCIHT